MENATMTGRGDAPVYDYRMYDRIWQRVSPDLDPYPEVRAAQTGGADGPIQTAAESAPAGTSSPAGMGAMPAPAMESGEAGLPGAEQNPCCMGTLAQESVDVIAGFIDEELADSRCCMALSRQVRSQSAARLFHRIACEKQAAARDLRAAYYLITGTCYAPVITVERRQWRCLADLLRSCYHQEACSGFNYQRAADEAEDLCLQKLLNRLGEEAYRRAEDVLDLLGKVMK